MLHPISHAESLTHLCLASNFVSTRESLHVLLDLATAAVELNVGSVLEKSALLLQLRVLLATDGRETPVLADDDLLATGELVHGSSKSLDGGGTVGVTGSDGQKDLTNVDTGDGTLRLAPSTSHSGLQSIGTSARQHLVDTDNVEWVCSNSHVETFLASNLDEIPEIFVRSHSFSSC